MAGTGGFLEGRDHAPGGTAVGKGIASGAGHLAHPIGQIARFGQRDRRCGAETDVAGVSSCHWPCHRRGFLRKSIQL